MKTLQLWQDVVTVTADGQSGNVVEVVQGRGSWLDCAGVPAIALKIEIYYLTTNSKLVLETAASEEGPWSKIAESTSPMSETIYAATEESAVYKLLRFVRWRFEVPSGATQAYAATFRAWWSPQELVAVPQRTGGRAALAVNRREV